MNFSMLGVAGYIAPRHLCAIQDVGGQLVSAADPCESVGILDSFFPGCYFFTDFERFDAFNRRFQDRGEKLDWLTVCTPNDLHLPHAQYGLRLGANVICEKPLALSLEELDAMEEVERQTGRRVYTILQLRLHDSIRRLKARIDAQADDKLHDVDLTYITARGQWYHATWKADPRRSGGIATNIGIHLFDMLTWVFGPIAQMVLHVHTETTCAGVLDLQRARVRFFLSIDGDTLPPEAVQGEKRTYRLVNIDGEEFEFSQGFTELHTESYRRILGGEGYGLDQVRGCLRVVEAIRHAETRPPQGDCHPYVMRLRAH